jgi:hypothetical protein
MTAPSVVLMPAGIDALPRDKADRPVPWFVAWIDGIPDFRVIGPGKLEDAQRFGLCWICGERRGRYGSFVLGSMCAVNRASAEPPSHRDCAVYAARTCPFLTTPGMRRREARMPDGTVLPAGEMITRNPGVALVWTSRNWHTFPVPNGVLWNVGDPTSTEWFAHGRPATRDEVTASIDSGLPLLRAEAERDGARAVVDLDRLHTAALAFLPAE